MICKTHLRRTSTDITLRISRNKRDIGFDIETTLHKLGTFAPTRAKMKETWASRDIVLCHGYCDILIVGTLRIGLRRISVDSVERLETVQ